MKTKTIFLLTVITAFTAVLFYSCGDSNPQKSEDNSCGSDVESFKSYTPSNLTSLPFSQVTNGRRYYDFYLHYDSICTDEHVWVGYHGQKDTGCDVNFRGVTEWFVLWEVSDSGFYTSFNNLGVINWEGENSGIGLKQTFGENAADVYVNVYVDIPSQGSYQADSIYLCQKVNIVGWTFRYKYHKSASADNMLKGIDYRYLSFIYEEKVQYPNLDIIRARDFYPDINSHNFRDDTF